MPRVTVVMATFNSEDTILKAIEFIQNQTFVDWEMIICDDCSTDSTQELIHNLQNKDNRIKCIKNSKNMYAAYSRNRCIELAIGEYIVIQDSDDYSHADRIQITVDFLDKNKNVSFVSTSAFFIENNTIWGERVLISGVKSSTDLIKGMCFIHAATTFRKESLDKVGWYRVDKETRRGQDYDLFMRFYAAGLFGVALSIKLYYISETKNGYKRRKFRYRIDEVKIRFKGYRSMKVRKLYYIYIIKPLIIGLIPNYIMLCIKKLRNGY